MDTMQTTTLVRRRDEGEATWFFNALMTTKASMAETGGAYSLTEHLVTAASNPPMHVQVDEDEAFYVLDGEVEFEVDGRRRHRDAGHVRVRRPWRRAPVPRAHRDRPDARDLLGQADRQPRGLLPRHGRAGDRACAARARRHPTWTASSRSPRARASSSSDAAAGRRRPPRRRVVRVRIRPRRRLGRRVTTRRCCARPVAKPARAGSAPTTSPRSGRRSCATRHASSGSARSACSTTSTRDGRRAGAGHARRRGSEPALRRRCGPSSTSCVPTSSSRSTPATATATTPSIRDATLVGGRHAPTTHRPRRTSGASRGRR